MRFIRGVIHGVAVAGGAAAWYLSKAGETFRNQYRVDRKLGVLGDEIEERTRDVRSRANAQVAEMRLRADREAAAAVADKLDEAQASAPDYCAGRRARRASSVCPSWRNAVRLGSVSG